VPTEPRPLDAEERIEELILSLPLPLPLHSWQSYVHTDGALEWRQKQLRQRAAEVSEALTELEQLQAGAREVPGVPLAGRLQLTGALAAGHSFGAVTAMVAAQVKHALFRSPSDLEIETH
jgi:hypothetical protein